MSRKPARHREGYRQRRHDRERRDKREYTHTTASSSPTQPQRRTSTTRYGRGRRSAVSLSGMALLTVTKGLDAVTTGVGLLYIPKVYEANVLASAVLREVGVVTGLVIMSFVIVTGITLVTEIASISVCTRRLDGHLTPLVRIVGYGAPSLLFTVVSIHNVAILFAGLEGVVSI